MKGVHAWQMLFEKVLAPATGLGIVIFAALGGPVPLALYPVAVFLTGLPGWRLLDVVRKNHNGK